MSGRRTADEVSDVMNRFCDLLVEFRNGSELIFLNFKQLAELNRTNYSNYVLRFENLLITYSKTRRCKVPKL